MVEPVVDGIVAAEAGAVGGKVPRARGEGLTALRLHDDAVGQLAVFHGIRVLLVANLGLLRARLGKIDAAAVVLVGRKKPGVGQEREFCGQLGAEVGLCWYARLPAQRVFEIELHARFREGAVRIA